jgi:hypothetical protein
MAALAPWLHKPRDMQLSPLASSSEPSDGLRTSRDAFSRAKLALTRRASAALLAGAVLAGGTAAHAQVARPDGPIVPLAASPSSSEPGAEDAKSPFAALAWELIPGAGSLYADDVPGAITTWALIVGGTAASVWGFSMMSFPDSDTEPRHSTAAAMPLLLSGLGLAVFGRIHGFVSAYAATERYNAALASRSIFSASSLSFAPCLTSGGSPGFVLGGRF